MGLVIFRHGQDRDHGNTSLFTLLPSGSFIHSSQVCIHISRISTASRHFFTGCGNLTESVCIVGDICQDNQYMHILFKGQILRSSQSHLRSGNTLNCRVVGQIDEKHGSVNSSGFLETFCKEVSFLESNAQSCKYYSEVFS